MVQPTALEVETHCRMALGQAILEKNHYLVKPDQWQTKIPANNPGPAADSGFRASKKSWLVRLDKASEILTASGYGLDPVSIPESAKVITKVLNESVELLRTKVKTKPNKQVEVTHITMIG